MKNCEPFVRVDFKRLKDRDMVLKGDAFHPFANLPGGSFFFAHGTIGLGEKCNNIFFVEQ